MARFLEATVRVVTGTHTGVRPRASLATNVRLGEIAAALLGADAVRLPQDQLLFPRPAARPRRRSAGTRTGELAHGCVARRVRDRVGRVRRRERRHTHDPGQPRLGAAVGEEQLLRHRSRRAAGGARRRPSRRAAFGRDVGRPGQLPPSPHVSRQRAQHVEPAPPVAHRPLRRRVGRGGVTARWLAALQPGVFPGARRPGRRAVPLRRSVPDGGQHRPA